MKKCLLPTAALAVAILTCVTQPAPAQNTVMRSAGASGTWNRSSTVRPRARAIRMATSVEGTARPDSIAA